MWHLCALWHSGLVSGRELPASHVRVHEVQTPAIGHAEASISNRGGAGQLNHNPGQGNS